MLKSLFAIAAVAAGFAAAPVLATTYIPLDYEADYSSVTVLDYDSISADGAYKSAWVVVIDQDDKIEDGVVKARIQWIFDCGRQRSAIRHLQLFQAADQPPANDWPLPDSELKWQPVDPESIGGSATGYVCGGKAPTADNSFSVADEAELYDTVVGMHQQKTAK